MVILDWLYEYWIPVVGYEGLYEVSNQGQIRSLNYNHTGKPRLLKRTKDSNGYYVVSLHKGCGNRKDREKKVYVHRLVAQAFLPNPDNLPFINHKDENTSNPCVWNLEWCSVQYNSTYKSAAHKCDKPVGAFKNGVLIKKYERGIDVARDGYGRGLIYRVIDKPPHTAYGYEWKHIN